MGSEATNEHQHILFDSKTGALLYDADGSGAGAAVQFAVLRGSALSALSYEHFEIV